MSPGCLVGPRPCCAIGVGARVPVRLTPTIPQPLRDPFFSQGSRLSSEPLGEELPRVPAGSLLRCWDGPCHRPPPQAHPTTPRIHWHAPFFHTPPRHPGPQPQQAFSPATPHRSSPPSRVETTTVALVNTKSRSLPLTSARTSLLRCFHFTRPTTPYQLHQTVVPFVLRPRFPTSSFELEATHPVADPRHRLPQSWTSGTRSFSGAQISEWVPIISAAVGVHLEMEVQAHMWPGPCAPPHPGLAATRIGEASHPGPGANKNKGDTIHNTSCSKRSDQPDRSPSPHPPSDCRPRLRSRATTREGKDRTPAAPPEF